MGKVGSAVQRVNHPHGTGVIQAVGVCLFLGHDGNIRCFLVKEAYYCVFCGQISLGHQVDHTFLGNIVGLTVALSQDLTRTASCFRGDMQKPAQAVATVYGEL